MRARLANAMSAFPVLALVLSAKHTNVHSVSIKPSRNPAWRVHPRHQSSTNGSKDHFTVRKGDIISPRGLTIQIIMDRIHGGTHPRWRNQPARRHSVLYQLQPPPRHHREHLRKTLTPSMPTYKRSISPLLPQTQTQPTKRINNHQKPNETAPQHAIQESRPERSRTIAEPAPRHQPTTNPALTSELRILETKLRENAHR